MRILVFMAVLLLMVGSVQGETLGDLLWQFRQCINEPDTSTSLCRDTAVMLWLNMAQHKVVMMAGYLPKSTELSYVYDSTVYKLPTDFHKLRGPGEVMARDNYQWLPTFFNPGFAVDTTANSYNLSYKHADQARIIMRGKYLSDGQIIKVEYFARAPDMVQRVDSCYVPSNLHVFIIEEAMSYYERAKRNFAAYQLENQSVRLDLGVLQSQQSGRQ